MKYCLYEYKNSDNLGDEIQSIAARQFLPSVDFFVDRDNWDKTKINEPSRLIANGWYTHNNKEWLPKNKFITPLFISFHITPKSRELFSNKQTLAFLEKNGPIGCRDFATKEFLESHGVSAYFSGCLTLTLKRKTNIARTNNNILVDIPEYIAREMPFELNQNVTKINQYFDPTLKFLLRVENKIGLPLSRGLAFTRAQRLLDRYCAANSVITQRLHCALPCTAMEVPVVFLVPHYKDARYKGLITLTNHLSYEEFLDAPEKITLLNNKNSEGSEVLRNKLTKICENFVADGTRPECKDLA
ncbi:polysaccharide pyruvyl transferase family protein [Alteromonas sp. A081]|uniref:polysaccharide pyruvyl transferase family protein n=1 Tax=Alteromonas sp. A081 TaxID=3410269 RepID=UPI003B97E6DB